MGLSCAFFHSTWGLLWHTVPILDLVSTVHDEISPQMARWTTNGRKKVITWNWNFGKRIQIQGSQWLKNLSQSGPKFLGLTHINISKENLESWRNLIKSYKISDESRRNESKGYWVDGVFSVQVFLQRLQVMITKAP
jgi:hypothetical protein